MSEPNLLDGARSYVSYQILGGSPVTIEVVREELRRLPLDGVLGVLALLCLDAAKNGDHFYDPRHQGGWLNLAIVDDFPTTLPNASKMYAPGRVPITGGRHVLVHQHNIAWLAHQALMHCISPSSTPELDRRLQTRCYRLLMVASDFLSGGAKAAGLGLAQRREVALGWLRFAQFTQLTDAVFDTLRRVARYYLLYKRFLRRHLDIEPEFQAATGVSIDLYFSTLTVILTHVFGLMVKEGRHWQKAEGAFSELECHQSECERVLRRWLTTPQAYRAAHVQRAAGQGAAGFPDSAFNYIGLKTHPLIEARPGQYVIPALPFLFTKVVDDLYYILSDHLKGQAQRRFQQALGCAYEDYAQALIRRILSKGAVGAWRVFANPRNRNGDELADTYAQRNDGVAIAFEHKGQMSTATRI